MSEPSAAPAGLATHRLASAWFVLALAALGLSALFAAVLVVARTPFLGQGATWFRTALVLHVNLAVTIWFLAVAAGMWSLHAGRVSRMRWLPWGLALAGTLAMLITPLAGDARPVLSNYLPLLEHPLFIAGLALLGTGVSGAGIYAWIGRSKARTPLARSPIQLAVLALLAALGVLLIDCVKLQSPGLLPVTLQDSLWGIGHNLQFVHVLLLMAAWLVLGHEALARVPGLQACLPWIFMLTLLPLAGGPVVALVYSSASLETHAFYTGLMRWASWPGAMVLGLGLLTGLQRLRRERSLAEDERALVLSIILFGAGCLLGATIEVDTLTVPAHYHATVGAVTLAYLLWLRRLAPQLGIAQNDLALSRHLPMAYGFGLLILVTGLAAAGISGVARKSPHLELNLDSASYLLAMGTAGTGGLIALSAVAALVFIGLRAAWRVRRPAAPRRKDIRWWAMVMAALVVALGGWLVKTLPGSMPGSASLSSDDASGKPAAELVQRFEQGVIMLHAKQYAHALTAFSQVMQMAPAMPEAHVNAGFALLGLQRFEEAHDVFERATQLRSSQINAYYGLALALEGMGDLPGARGAMQTFVHLSKADDPFRAKGEAILVQWRKSPGSQSTVPAR